MKKFAQIYLIFTLVLLPVVLLASWVVGAYNSDVRSLLDGEGVRWGVNHIMSNFSQMRLDIILMLMVTVSVVLESGYLSGLLPKNRPLMLKQLRAYTYTNLVLIAIVVCFFLLLFMPASPLLNAFGGFEHSPLARSFPVLLSLVFILLGNIYGYLSGRLVTSADFAFAHTAILRKYSPSFIPLFIVSQIVGCMEYSNFFSMMGVEAKGIIVHVLLILCFIR